MELYLHVLALVCFALVAFAFDGAVSRSVSQFLFLFLTCDLMKCLELVQRNFECAFFIFCCVMTVQLTRC